MLVSNIRAACYRLLQTLPMPSERPPTIDPIAAARWHASAPALSPWLHEEVARRMEARLQWIRQAPATWCHWDPVRGGLQAHALIRQRYPDAACVVTETSPTRQADAVQALTSPWWTAARWAGGKTRFEKPAPGSMQMLWANMALHMAADPDFCRCAEAAARAARVGREPAFAALCCVAWPRLARAFAAGHHRSSDATRWPACADL